MSEKRMVYAEDVIQRIRDLAPEILGGWYNPDMENELEQLVCVVENTPTAAAADGQRWRYTAEEPPKEEDGDCCGRGAWRIVMAAACGSKRRRSRMDKQKIKSIPRLTTDNPVDNFQTALNFTDVSEDGWVWLRQPEMALTEYMRKLVKGHGSSIDLDCNDMELSESQT